MELTSAEYDRLLRTAKSAVAAMKEWEKQNAVKTVTLEDYVRVLKLALVRVSTERDTADRVASEAIETAHAASNQAERFLAERDAALSHIALLETVVAAAREYRIAAGPGSWSSHERVMQWTAAEQLFDIALAALDEEKK